VRGTRADWYRNLRKTPTIRVAAGGAEATSSARPITDPAAVSDVVDRFRAKYGADDVARYYERLDAAVEVPLD
jgi:hypothetical protein